MRVYIAAKYGRRHELRALDARLRELGHEPTSRWIHDGEEGKGLREAAEMDVSDVLTADAILFVGQPRGSENRGGGRWFELGLAWGASKRCLVVLPNGEHESVFTALPGVEVYETQEGAVANLDREPE